MKKKDEKFCSVIFNKYDLSKILFMKNLIYEKSFLKRLKEKF